MKLGGESGGVIPRVDRVWRKKKAKMEKKV